MSMVKLDLIPEKRTANLASQAYSIMSGDYVCIQFDLVDLDISRYPISRDRDPERASLLCDRPLARGLNPRL
jgi:hypothetical protein